ncbi:hypothetical protein [Saccharopolyspora karakumensis]|uniref:hypothetical protein n=1 Tax=Saccharopolyspora karakumensis TaxID=2530386 RepID=UPI00140448E7|nr:hypothetical protein [Saccharopolyspora karakumensis]
MTAVTPDESADPEPRSGGTGHRPDAEHHRSDVPDTFERVLEEDAPTIHRGLD